MSNHRRDISNMQIDASNVTSVVSLLHVALLWTLITEKQSEEERSERSCESSPQEESNFETLGAEQ